MKKPTLLTRSVLCALFFVPAPLHLAAKEIPKKKNLSTTIKGLFKPFKSIFGKKKNLHEEKPEMLQQAVPAPTPPPADLRTALETLQSAAVQAPELYALIINDSVDRLLEKADSFSANLRWGTQDCFIEQLTSKAILEKNKASLLLQMKIWEMYLDDPMPFKTFIQDLTKERILLEEYEAAISKLSTNEWFKNNEVLDKRTKKVLDSIKKKKQNLEQLNSLVLELLNKQHDLSDQNVFRLLQKHLAQQQSLSSGEITHTLHQQPDEVDLLKRTPKNTH